MDEVRKLEDVACGDNPAKTEKASESTTGRGAGEGGAATSVVVERMRQLVSCINTAMTFSSETGRARRGRPILSRVMRESLVFVEVKTRSDCEKGFPR